MISLYDPDQALATLVEQLAIGLPARGQRLVSAESCTGGLIAAACTDIAGSSAWFERGFVTYSNAAKQECLDVGAALLAEHGAVSKFAVAAMLAGALTHSSADWAIAVSGVAGPGGGTPDKPVGTVYIGWQARAGQPQVAHYLFAGDRDAIRRASVLAALTGLRERIGTQ
jgi:nicotinamide-nucleotide amidase